MANKPAGLKTLADLGQVQRTLAEAREREAAAAAARAAAERKLNAEKDLFSRAIGATQPLRRVAAVPLAPEPPAPIPVQHQLDEQRVLRESLSDEFDVETLLDVDDAMSFRRPGIGTEVTRRLRAGEWSIQQQLDMHGMRSASSTPVSPIAWSMQASHSSRSRMPMLWPPMLCGRWRARSIGWPKRSV